MGPHYVWPSLFWADFPQDFGLCSLECIDRLAKSIYVEAKQDVGRTDLAQNYLPNYSKGV